METRKRWKKRNVPHLVIPAGRVRLCPKRPGVVQYGRLGAAR